MRYFRTLIISIGIHFALVIVLMQINPPQFRPQKQITIVDLLESPEPRRRPKQEAFDTKQFVRSAPAPEELKTDKKREKRFSSEEEQIVLEETQARKSGLTANRSGEPQKPKSKTEKKKPQDELDFSPSSILDRKAALLEEETLEPDGDLHVGGLKNGRPQPKTKPSSESRDLILPGFNGAEVGVSTVGEALPEDIKFGDFTALNTDRHLYYTFYARMEEQIRHRWVTYAKAAVYSTLRSSKLTGNETWETQLEIVLDQKGNFVRAILHDSSGISGLDSAPVQAFRDAQQFPNPPQEMVKEDGTIRLHYTFNVNIIPRYASGGE